MVKNYYKGHSEGKTLGDMIQKNYPDFKVVGGCASMDYDITQGYEVDITEDSYRHCTRVRIYPFVEWTDGTFRPCHYWGEDDYHLILEKENITQNKGV